jgi:hypothetical protein
MLLFPSLILFQNLPAHVLADSLGTVDGELIRTVDGLIADDVVALDDGGVGAGTEL